jgi:hypothetical protein
MLQMSDEKLYILKDWRGQQIGKPSRDTRILYAKACDLLAGIDMNQLSKREKELVATRGYTVEEL